MFCLHLIVSGGQTGVDRAALDVALELGIPCGGWCPKNRLAEDGSIPARYPLTETPSVDYAERTRWNVRDSDATLVLTFGEPSGGTAFTVECARMERKPCLVIDLDEAVSPSLAVEWLRTHAVGILNVAGPRASANPAAYERARDFLFHLLK
ncbi:MAG: putative molybdenum carrier protein [Candidatus Hydrogenedentes bacterium]|nr:putative molybdenum carrier protein [Candidatus Hydrogenedentota bacterium]